MQRMRNPVRQKRLNAPVREQHLDPADGTRGRVPRQRSGEILPDFSYYPAESAHGAKNGVLM
jgi:hypothetical protein